jgi:amino acid adenylation domain-containing protein
VQVNVLEYFEAYLAKADRARIAIVEQARSFTFGQVEESAKRCASILVRRMDVTNELIAVFLPKSAETVFADLGILYSGNIYTNLDIHSPDQRIRNILDKLKPALVITSYAYSDKLRSLGVAAEWTVCIEDAISSEVAFDNRALWKRLDRIIDTDPVCVINTSGSTGTPKGVTLSHRGTVDFMDWTFTTLKLDGTERIGSLSPFYFDIYTLELITMLAKGATLVIIPDGLATFPVRLMEFLATQKASFLFWVPSIMVNISNQGLLDKIPVPDIRKVLFAGEVFPTKHLNRWRRALPQATFVNLYGPIEIHVDCTYFVLDRELGDDEPLSIGYPCRNTEVLILNEKNKRCEIGEQGELCIRGSSLAMGYWNDPEKTAAAFVQNPLNTRYPELIYRTGDIGYRNERDEIHFVGRKDFQIKHMGYRIELSEIEHRVLCVEGIANACVLYNSDKKEISLFYESKGEQVTRAAIRKELLSIFPKYMLPTAFYPMQELPRNRNGKIDRNGLSLQLKKVE